MRRFDYSFLDFLRIHPFRDGNGRMPGLLSLLLLYKNGFDIGNIFPSKNRSIVIKPHMMKHCGSPLIVGAQMRTAISRLLKTFY